MADYYIDLSLAANGDGTTASPWNQCTATQLAGVVGGDNLWFKRFDPGVDIDIITWKAGTDDSNRINYIGWPLAGDTHYATRSADLIPTWDAIATTYVYQRKVVNGICFTIPSNVNIYRFYFNSTYSSNATQRNIYMYNVSNIFFDKCYFYNNYATRDNYNYSGHIYAEGCTNIQIHRSILNGQGSYNYRASDLFKMRTSSVIFSECSFYFGTNVATPMTVNSLAGEATSYLNGCTASFLNSIFNIQYAVAGSVESGYYYSGVMYFANSNTTISGCTVSINNTNDSTSYLLHTYPALYVFKSYMGTLSIQNTTTTCNHRKYGFLLTQSTNVTMEDISWTVTSKPSNIFLDIRGSSNITLRNITGSVYEGSKDYMDVNYFIAFSNWSVILNNNIVFDNVQQGLGYILDMSRDADLLDIVLKDKNYPVLMHSTLYASRFNSITFDNVSFAGIKLNALSDSSGRNIQGGLPNTTKVTLENSAISNIPIQIGTTFSKYTTDVTLYNNTGNGSSIFSNDSAINYYLTLKAIRNKGFTSLGTTDISGVEVYSTLNSFNTGTSLYSDINISYQTSPIYRVNGASYSVEIFKKSTDGVRVDYPKLGDDTIWMYIPGSGTFRVTAFLKYLCTSGTWITDDIKLTVDIYNDYSELIISNVFEEDTQSTWTTTGNGTAIKLTCDITVASAQYCPVRLYIYKKLEGQIIYFDPKLSILDIS